MQTATYVRIFTDDQGDSRFEDCSMPMAPAHFAPPAAPLNVAAIAEARAVAFVGGEPAWQGDIPHPSPRRQLMCILSGGFETTASDGEKRTFLPGNLLLLEDTQGKGHTTRLLEPTIVLAIELI
jgi:hypothetical protein